MASMEQNTLLDGGPWALAIAKAVWGALATAVSALFVWIFAHERRVTKLESFAEDQKEDSRALWHKLDKIDDNTTQIRSQLDRMVGADGERNRRHIL